MLPTPIPLLIMSLVGTSPKSVFQQDLNETFTISKQL